MEPNNHEFVEANKDFILKLKIKATDGTSQIRRVRLPRITDASGLVSYDELVGLCVTFTFPEGSPDNYEVSLTYFDVDEDTVTIASTHELVDAIEQFADKKVLRVTTEVKPRVSSSASNTANPTAGRSESTTVQPPIKNVLESFVGILSTAVTHLQEGLNASEKATTPTNVHVPAARGGGIVPPSETNTYNTRVAQTPAESEEETPVEESPEDPIPFIHGRHTCDSCLVTPIIGKRFHATNLPDYDLCEKCHSNYQGVEVKFESVELERDRSFQERWQRRHQKLQRFHARHANKANRAAHRGQRRYRRVGNCGLRRPGPTGIQPPQPRHVGVPPPPPPAVPPPTVFPPHVTHPGGHPAFAPHHAPPHGPPRPPPHGHPFGRLHPYGPPHWANVQNQSGSAGAIASEYDSALKEAIRRSLRDVTTEQRNNKDEDKIEAPTKTAEQREVALKATPSAADVPMKKEELAPVKNDEDEAAATLMPENNVEAEVAHVFEGFEMDDTRAMVEAMETGSVDSEKLLAEDDRKPPAVDRENSASSDKTKDESFQSEAVGSGEVAEAVGATLDLVAGMISEMLSEADLPSPTQKAEQAPGDIKNGDVFREDTVEESSEKNTDIALNATIEDGALIMEDNGEPESDSIVSKQDENEWEVVGADENIARAAEMLGSLLFNSEVKSAEEHESHSNVSNLSDSFSVPSTVPSISVGAPQRTRWASHLAKLSELGFNNEAQCVEILERLQAANIGADETDEVSVTQVINRLLEEA